MEIQKFRKIDSSKLSQNLKNQLKYRVPEEQIYIKSIAIAFCIRHIQMNAKGRKYALKNIELFDDASDKLKNILETHTAEVWDLVDENIEKYSDDTLTAFILFSNRENNVKSLANSTPKGVINLSEKILKTKNEDKFLELCSGDGSYFVETFPAIHHYTGMENNEIANEIIYIRACVLGIEIKILQKDVLTYVGEEKYDNVFVHPSFALKIGTNGYSADTNGKLEPSELDRASSDWIFASKVIECLKEKGRGISIMTNASTWNISDRNIRKAFIEKGYIEAVIALPEKLLLETGIATTLVVFSMNNEKIRLINASECCYKGRRQNTLRKSNIQEIVELLDKDSEISTMITKEELVKNDYIIHPQRNMLVPIVKNGIELGSVIKKISRGASIKADELDRLRAQQETSLRYVAVSNVKNGALDFSNDVQYLKEVPEKYKKYCLKKNNIILSKTGNPTFKSAVVEKEAEIELLPSANFIVIEVDETKINPYYIQAFLASEKGVRSLKNMTTGAVTSIISAENLKKILIPDLNMEEQEEIVKTYKNSIKELEILQNKLSEAKKNIEMIFSDN